MYLIYISGRIDDADKREYKKNGRAKVAQRVTWEIFRGDGVRKGYYGRGRTQKFLILQNVVTYKLNTLTNNTIISKDQH